MARRKFRDVALPGSIQSCNSMTTSGNSFSQADPSGSLKTCSSLPSISILQRKGAQSLASRLPRLAWKYEGIAYRLGLLNAGVVIELMYLVATDMKLAPCANGSGDSRPFETATGLDHALAVLTAWGVFRPDRHPKRGPPHEHR